MENQKLEQAIAFFKAGNKNEARKILALLLQEQPNNENAWLWMSACVDIESQRVFCLRKVLEINPDNPNAIIMLESLSKKPANGKELISDKEFPKEKPGDKPQQKLQFISPPPEMDGTLGDLYEGWAKQVLIPPSIMEEFHNRFCKYLDSADPLFLVRMVSSQLRGQTMRTATGEQLRPTDNSPAWWIHNKLFTGQFLKLRLF